MVAATLEVPIPYDSLAEHTLAISEVWSRGAGRVAETMEQAAFYDQRAWRVAVAAAQLTSSGSFEDDLAHVARAAEVEPAELALWWAESPVCFDLSGSMRRRVLDTAAKRWRTYELAEELLQVAA